MSIELPAKFYLGKKFELGGNRLLDEPLHYSARNLTTHAVIIGMTGSGKTGLGISLLEEAALDGIPALIIDPKGDLTNLLLNFPELRPDDFLPWMETDSGESPIAEATRAAEQWKRGLAQWDIDGARLQKLRESADFTIFTPGSEAGAPVNILDALRMPAAGWDDDAENLREKIQGIVSALLGLIGVEADPLRSREHILLSHLIEHAWRARREMDIGQLILGIQDPPIRKLGVFDLDTFFPPKERFELAMALNAILAAPSFETWLKGEPFDVNNFLRVHPVPRAESASAPLRGAAQGKPMPQGQAGGKSKPRHSIFYIAHLSDAERLFFVSLLLQQVRSWMRTQSGTGNLRAILYFDEMFGYLPPYPYNPSTKTPLLYLLKNARAFGLGLVLATQNPIDLDYKALTNAGTWFIGKLQTQYDKARLLDGLQTIAAESGMALERDQLSDWIGALVPRVFLYHNIHEPPPITFQSRWAMSYLKGPLTRPQIRRLTRGGDVIERATSVQTQDIASPPYLASPPQISPEISQYYLPSMVSLSNHAEVRHDAAQTPTAAPTYAPHILGFATVTFDDRKTGTRHSVRYARLLPPAEAPRAEPDEAPHGGAREAGEARMLLDWAHSIALPLERKDLQTAPLLNAQFRELPNGFANPQKLTALQKAFVQYLYRESRLILRQNKTLKVVENPAQNERDFRQRCAEAARAGLEAEQRKIKAKFTRQLDKLAERLQKEQADLTAEQRELEERKSEEMWTNIESIAAFLGIGRAYRPLSTATRRRRMTKQSQSSIETAQETIEDLQRQLAELTQEMNAELLASRERWVAAQEDVVEFSLAPRKTDIHVEAFGIAWRPA